MPTYEYECTKCGHTFEILQNISAEPLKSCPKCKGLIRRLIGGGMGVIFKGSGFYSTDNKKSSSLTGGNGGSSKENGSGKESGSAKEIKSGGSESAAKSADKPKEKNPEKSTEKSARS